VLFDKNCFRIFYLKKYSYTFALEMASPRNQHCANCIGTLSFPIKTSFDTARTVAYDSERRALKIKIIGRAPLDLADSRLRQPGVL